MATIFFKLFFFAAATNKNENNAAHIYLKKRKSGRVRE
jgi:hypothetical protein